jgi:hypothetical protein
MQFSFTYFYLHEDTSSKYIIYVRVFKQLKIHGLDYAPQLPFFILLLHMICQLITKNYGASLSTECDLQDRKSNSLYSLFVSNSCALCPSNTIVLSDERQGARECSKRNVMLLFSSI